MCFKLNTELNRQTNAEILMEMFFILSVFEVKPMEVFLVEVAGFGQPG